MKKIIQIKGLVAGFALAGFALSANAQTGIDTTECKRQYSIFNEYYKQKNFDLAIDPWRFQFKNCEDLYLGTYVYGLVMYKEFYKKAETPELKQAYQDTIIIIYDKYLSKIEENPTKYTQYWDYKVQALAKATDLQLLNKDNFELTYPLFQKAFAAKPSVYSPNSLVLYMQAAAMKRTKKQFDCDTIADLYLKLTDIQEASFKATKDSLYLKAQANLDKLAETCLDCNLLVDNFTKQYATMKDDSAWVVKASNILDRKKCLSNSEISSNNIIIAIFEKAAEVNQSADGMFRLASLYIGKKQYGKAEDLIEKAISLEEDNDRKADFTFTLARINFQNGKNSEAKSNALKAARLRPNWGAPYIFIGDIYASAYGKVGAEDQCLKYGPLWAAADKYNYAKSIDPSSTDDANKQLGRVVGNYPDKQSIFFDCPNIKEGASVSVGGWIGESTTVRLR